ncbi:Protein FAM53A [Camelus dromedarius]|uniref:Protein FAM53A n=1 Tax=Camelus dromedarius TaxID=9838 RepID=A0A5N4EEJ5_CAMDR|nr:Protein FAM53A [Camelus dromedarius]
MVTLITEKLQNQSLDDLTHKSYDAGPCSAENVSSTGCLFPFETNKDKHPWKVVSRGPPVGSQAAAGPTVPFSPSSLGAVSARDLREPGGPPSAPPTKRHCRSLSEPDELARCRSPRPARLLMTPVLPRRRPNPPLTDSTLTPSRAVSRMRTLKNSKSLCSLDYEDEDEDDARVKTAVSSPRDPHGLQPRPAGLSPRASPEWVAAEGEGWSGGDPSDWDSAGEEGAFPLDRSRELDLEQIENN